MRIDWSPRAVADLKSISEYIEQDRTLETANRVARAIFDTVETLQSLPNRGRLGRVADTRELVVASLPYVVIYRTFAERVEILNIVHAAQRWP